MADAPLTLQLWAAKIMSFEKLRDRFWDIIVELQGDMGKWGPEFTKALDYDTLTRDQIVAIVEANQDWFDPWPSDRHPPAQG
jgi:hypothetical protein